ncbi:hypothetical protein [Zymobacter palmae]|uniref:hypothetical protein n=1 Tax=Zymobacter palmae TaxID=33074 RepID=UPI00056F0E8F|nr:hypothetical protein [Zymobacter palmae]
MHDNTPIHCHMVKKTILSVGFLLVAVSLANTVGAQDLGGFWQSSEMRGSGTEEPSRAEVWSNQWRSAYNRCKSAFADTRSVRLERVIASRLGTGRFNMTGEWICSNDA